MDYKATTIKLAISLLLSPIVVYLFLFLAKMAGSTYEMTNGENIYHLAANGYSDQSFLD